MRGRWIAFLGAGLGLMCGNPVRAHDSWLFPEQRSIAPGDTLVVRQRWGHDLDVELELPLDKDLTTRFELVTEHGAVDLLREDMPPPHPRLSPLLRRPVEASAGHVLLVMEHGEQRIELEAPRFRDHLHLEALDELVDRVGEGTQRELYTRSMKALVRVGDARGTLHGRIMGQQLELLLHQNPNSLSPGDSLGVTLLLELQPLTNQWVWAQHAGADGFLEMRARTDSEGSVRFQLAAPGFWLLRAVHLVPCPQCADAEWRSFWATYTFELE